MLWTAHGVAWLIQRTRTRWDRAGLGGTGQEIAGHDKTEQDREDLHVLFFDHPIVARGLV